MHSARTIKNGVAWLLLISFLLSCFSLFISASEGKTRHIFAKNREQVKKVALTFDDGPHPRYTPEILEILNEYHVKATFFVVGINAYHYPDILSKITASGCEIGNHTYSHLNLKHANLHTIREDVLNCENIIFKQTGTTPTIFRPPEGHLTPTASDYLNTLDYNIILWSIDTKDWAHTPTDQIVHHVKEHLNHGDIILMHDYISGENTTCDALRIMIPMILNMGYEFVTVSELINGAPDENR